MTDTAAASRAPMGVGLSADRGDGDEREAVLLAEPLAAESGCALYDVQWRGGTLVVLATALDGGPVGVDALSGLSRRLSAALDAADMIDGRYVLEVSSPGLERRLRRPEHFAGAVGERAVIRTSGPTRRRIVGEILEADGTAVSVRVEEVSGSAAAGRADQPETDRPGVGETLSVPFGDIAKARTTFEWGAQPRSPSERKQR